MGSVRVAIEVICDAGAVGFLSGELVAAAGRIEKGAQINLLIAPIRPLEETVIHAGTMTPAAVSVALAAPAPAAAQVPRAAKKKTGRRKEPGARNGVTETAQEIGGAKLNRPERRGA